MIERFQYTYAIVIHYVHQQVQAYLYAKKYQPLPIPYPVRFVQMLSEEGHGHRDQYIKYKGMGKATVCKEVGSGIVPKGCDEIYVGYTLCQCTQQHGPFAQLFTEHSFPHYGAQGNMC